MNRNFPEIVDLARRYCELIESSGSENPSWLKEIAALFSKLLAAINFFGRRTYDGILALLPDLDARFELYSHLLVASG